MKIINVFIFIFAFIHAFAWILLMFKIGANHNGNVKRTIILWLISGFMTFLFGVIRLWAFIWSM